MLNCPMGRSSSSVNNHGGGDLNEFSSSDAASSGADIIKKAESRCAQLGAPLSTGL